MYFNESISNSTSYRQKIDFEPTKSNLSIIQKTKDFKTFDYIFRVTYTSSSTTAIGLTKTETFRSNIENICLNFESDIQILANVVKSQKKLIEYNAIYNAFLLGQISEEEFIEESENYAYSPKNIDNQILLNKLKCLLKYTGDVFTSSELAEIFQCKHENVEEILKQLPNNTFTTTIK